MGKLLEQDVWGVELEEKIEGAGPAIKIPAPPPAPRPFELIWYLSPKSQVRRFMIALYTSDV